MKLSFPSLFGRKAAALLITVGTFVDCANLNAQVFLSFTGGGASEITVSWSTPITYTLGFNTPNPGGGNRPYFVFQGISNSQSIWQNQGAPLVAPTYNSTGAGSGDGQQSITTFYSVSPAGAQNAVVAGDFVFFSANDTNPSLLTAGDVITLAPGSFTYSGSGATTIGYGGALPANGFYNTIVVDPAYANLSAAGSAIPEPSTYAAIMGLGALGFVFERRRRRSAGAVTSPA
jgi:hypothetical protein